MAGETKGALVAKQRALVRGRARCGADRDGLAVAARCGADRCGFRQPRGKWGWGPTRSKPQARSAEDLK